jgi:hypothetical protein
MTSTGFTILFWLAVVGWLAWCFTKLSTEKKTGLILMFISGCIVASVVIWWRPSNITHVPLASLTLFDIGSTLFGGLLLIGCGKAFIDGFFMVIEKS